MSKGPPKPKNVPGGPDGRRRFGTVGAAVFAVLSATGEEMRVKAIHAEVERLLGGRVSRYSVSELPPHAREVAEASIRADSIRALSTLTPLVKGRTMADPTQAWTPGGQALERPRVTEYSRVGD